MTIQLKPQIGYSDIHPDGSTVAIRELRKKLYGRVPRHGTIGFPIPGLAQTAILAKQICGYMRIYGGWPR